VAEYQYNLRGEIDVASVQKLRADLADVIRREGVDLRVDCSALTFIDSSGIAVLLEANRDLEAQGRHMLIVNASNAPRRVFELLGLTDLLRYDRTVS
jgi:anti-sigma B factor antagonist